MIKIDSPVLDWKNIVNVTDVKLEPGPGIEPYLGDCNRLSEKMGAKKLGFNVRTILPGQFSCPYHFHHEEEEIFLILEGVAKLRQADLVREVSKGDLIFMTTGPDGAHQFYNHGAADCKLLALSTRDPKEVVEYPDSQKIYVSQIKKLFQSKTEVDYWKDEMNPAQHWPKENR